MVMRRKRKRKTGWCRRGKRPWMRGVNKRREGREMGEINLTQPARKGEAHFQKSGSGARERERERVRERERERERAVLEGETKQKKNSQETSRHKFKKQGMPGKKYLHNYISIFSQTKSAEKAWW